VDAQNLKQQLEVENKSVTEGFEYTDWPVFLSLDLIKEGFSAKKLSFSVDKFVILDENQKTLVVVNMDKKPKAFDRITGCFRIYKDILNNHENPVKGFCRSVS
jgi:hypothetical protein